MAEGERSGLADLEKELTCSICTDLLYQPLTLLDCLHTFCGACLKEWFQFQASTATSIHPYTCPACRATVVKTQRNASVTTLLEMFMKSSPNSGKGEAEKKADREKYKPGDNVMPKLRRREDPGAEEERRVLEEVQQLSLREAGITGAALEPPRERRRRERSRDRSPSSRNTARGERRSRSQNPPETAREVIPPRHVEHQSSLRSLLSASELDSQEVEEEIMRQIMEEGLLDGIDLNNIDVAQEDEITERIAQAYRARQAQRQRERRERRERLAREDRADTSASRTAAPQVAPAPSSREEDTPRRRPHGRSESGTSTPTTQTSSRPPVSRPELMDAANHSVRARHARSSSQGSSRSARRADRPTALAITSSREAASSASDLGQRSTAYDNDPPTRRRRSENQQRSALDARQQFRQSLQAHSASNPNSPRRMGFNLPASESPSSSTPVVASPLSSPPDPATPTTALAPPSARRTTDPTSGRHARLGNNGTPPMASHATFPRQTAELSVGEVNLRADTLTPTPATTAPTYPEPAISCNRCKKEHIEYEVHYNCSRCNRGDYNLCLSCYRAGKGCEHWYGFGWAAWPRYERQAPEGGYPPDHEHPHILVGHRYQRPRTPLTESNSAPHTLSSGDDPTHRLEAGVFCEICHTFANGCYWKCDICNQGAWGFCNDCVNQGRHCTHPLLPMTRSVKEPTTNPTEQPSSASPQRPETSSRAGPLSPGLTPPTDDQPATTPPLTPKTASLIGGPGLITIANSIFRPLTFTTLCNKCNYPIPPSHTRYHCLKCNKGDFDLCMSCYHKLVATSRISKEDGPHGWRRCPRGHRMVVVGFEDRDGGQRRVVVKDLVGGFALRDSLEDKDAGPPRSPSSSLLNWSWCDTEGNVHKYRTPSSLASTSSSAASNANTLLRFPPDGGIGLRVLANWSYFPAEGVNDELGFPRNAEIREAEDINGDWFWGVYAGAKGLFPGNYGTIIGGREESVRMI